MAFCRNCGKEIDEKAVICIHCGVSQTDANSEAHDSEEDRKASASEIAASILLPIVGVILGIVYVSKGKKTAGSTCLIAGIIAWVVWMILFSL